MKTIRYRLYATSLSVLCLLSGLCVSCSDFLEVKPLDIILAEDFWTDKDDVDKVVNGCYAVLLQDGIRQRMMVWGEGRSDNVAGGLNITNQANLYNVLKENITAMNSYTTWDGFYTVINRCNNVLKYAPIVADADPSYTRSDLHATIAEMTALRSLCYFYLIRTFRDVPYSTEAFIDDSQRMDLPATPFYDVLDSLINDLERVKGDAVTRYPQTEPRDQTGRITRDAIYAMLCEMYLWKKDYDNCIRYADLLIQSKKAAFTESIGTYNSNISAHEAEQMMLRTSGFPLVTDNLGSSTFGAAYRSIFARGNSEESNNSYEIIFAIDYEDSPTGTGTMANSAVEFLYGNSRDERGALVASSVVTEDALKKEGRGIYEDANQALDSRLYTNCDATTGNITKYSTSSQVLNLESTEDVAVNEKKVANGVSPVERTYFAEKNNGSNWIVYRTADIMPLKAEALCQQMREGSDSAAINYNRPLLDQAFTLVNAINKRSICKDVLQDTDTLKRSNYNTKVQMEGLVERERQRELMFEGKRYYDLVRYTLRDNNTNNIASVMSKRDDVNSTYVSNFFKKIDAIFWPYNYEEMRVNRNLKPNPAFGTGENESYEKTGK